MNSANKILKMSPLWQNDRIRIAGIQVKCAAEQAMSQKTKKKQV